MSGETSRINGRKGGRKRGSKATHTLTAEKAKEYIINRVTAELEPIITKQLSQAKDGDGIARKDLLDRAFGRPTETIEHKGLEFFMPLK